jgi:CHAT domain-containing protein
MQPLIHPPRQGTVLALIRAETSLILLSLYALIGLGQTSTGNQIQELPPNQTIERELTGTETHRYKFTLQANDFFQVRVEQKGVDVALRLVDANGTVLATMDSPNSKDGPETLSFVATAMGSYLLEVAGFDSKAEKGIYAIRREVPRTATPKDQRRVKVEQLFVAGIAARDAGGQAEIAIRKLADALAGWDELGDKYLVELTAATLASLRLQDLNNELQVAGRTLGEGQRLSVRSKQDLIPGRAKLIEALDELRLLNSKLTDKTLLETIAKSGAKSEEFLNSLKTQQFSARLYEGVSLDGIALAYHNAGEWQKSVDYEKLAIAVHDDVFQSFKNFNGGPNHQVLLLALQSSIAQDFLTLGQRHRILGQRDEALSSFNQGLERSRALYQQTKQAEFKGKEAMVLQEIGLIYTHEARTRQIGIEFLWKAIESYRSVPDRKANIAQVLSIIGGQYSLDLDYESALSNYDDALKVYRDLGDPIGQLDNLVSRGTVYVVLDNRPKVQENFSQALLILQSPDFAEQFKKHFAGPDLPQGADLFSEALDSLIEYHRLDRIGFAFERLEEYEKATQYYERALAIARLRQRDEVRGELRSIAYNYAELKSWEKAADYYVQALNISRNNSVKEDLADDLADVGWTLMEGGKAREALSYQSEALGLYHSVGIGKTAFSLHYVRLLHEVARTYDALNNRALAIFFGKQGINALQGARQRLRNLDAVSQQGFLRRSEKHYRRLADWLIAGGRIIEAEQELQMLKEEEVSDYLRRDKSVADKLSLRVDFTAAETRALRSYEGNSRTISSLAAELERLEESKKSGTLLTPEQQKRYDELKTRLSEANAEFEKFLAQLAEEFKQGKNPAGEINEDKGLQSDMQEWGGDLAFIYTLVGEHRYRTILITPNTRVAREKEIKAADLDQKIIDFRKQVKNPKFDPRPLGKELYDILIKPIEKELNAAGAKTLLWSLDGNLRLLPLAALWDGQQYFGQKYQNVVITLASRTRIGRDVAPTLNVLGLGVSEAQSVPEPFGERRLPFSSLPSVPFELTSIVRNRNSPKGILPGESLLNAGFTEKALEEQLAKGYKVIHIASHFSMNAGDATKSFLLLGDGTPLTVNELNNNPALKLTGVELLTLSACETAVAERDSSGKEVEGFAYVAQERGAKAILATLWSVADESTALLMTEFYRIHKGNPQLTKAAALQLAQREMIEGKLQPKLSTGTKSPGTKQADTSSRTTTDDGVGAASQGSSFPYDPKKPYAHPYYWAPFILIGNWK